MVLPMNRVNVAKAGALIEENLIKDAVRRTDASMQAEKDFLLAATVEMASVTGRSRCLRGGPKRGGGPDHQQAGADACPAGRGTQIHCRSHPRRPVGKTKVGKDFHQAHIYRKHSFEVPSRVLLVDDEREFVQTLSERLQLRDMGSAVAYDGESALALVAEDEPEVMIIDLKMPGIDGMEILKQVKATRPGIEVIVLTGHGSEADRKQLHATGGLRLYAKARGHRRVERHLEKSP
jgi:two-component system response regulator CpxR